VDSGRASRRAKIALANLYAIIAHSQERETGLATCEEARRILAALGALDLTDLTAASVYGDATDTQARIAVRLGRLDDARQLATLVGEMAEKVLARRPGDLQAMINRYYAANVLGQVAATRNQYVEAEAHFKQAVEASKNYVLFNPADNLGWRSWSGGEVDLGNVMAQQGRLTEAMQQSVSRRRTKGIRATRPAPISGSWMLGVPS
jgi:tetratricopeptide (TPR) repeat protein